MPKEMIYTGPVVGIDKIGNAFPADAVPEGAIVEFHTEGIDIRWGREGTAVEIGIGMVNSGGAMSQGERPRGGYYTQMDRDALRLVINALQKAGRQAFGVDPW